MDAIRSRSGSPMLRNRLELRPTHPASGFRSRGAARRVGAVMLGSGWLLLAAAAPLRDAPVVWFDDDAHDISMPKERDPDLAWDGIDATLQAVDRQINFGRLGRRVGTLLGGDPAAAAADVNGLDEVANSTWFTNRIGLFPTTPEAVGIGPGTGEGPDRSGPWTIVGAKTEGVTPGFRIQDARGDVYLIKFDPPEFSGLSSSAGVISGKLLYSCGYNVPEDAVVEFRRTDLVVGENVPITLATGEERAMSDADVDDILIRVLRNPDGTYRAVSSKFLEGEPVGPFDWSGRRKDDPNDRIPHEHRRSLRGLRLIAAWINHFDTKQGNTLDMVVEEGGRRFLRHHLIDFASTLGAGATGPRPAFGFEYSIDLTAIGGRAFALGLHEDAWRRISRPDSLPEIGYFESREFHPDEWKPLVPNAAFANLTDRDGYWAAKIVSAFTDDHLRAAVAAGRYRDPRAAAHQVRLLGERRDKLARIWFDRVPPLDFFTFDGSSLRFHDLGRERGIYPDAGSRYRVRLGVSTAEQDAAAWSGWSDLEATAVNLEEMGAASMLHETTHPFWVLALQVDRGRGWSSEVRVYVGRASGRVVAVTR